MFMLGIIEFDLSAISVDMILIAVVGYCVVFFALVVLYFCFRNVPVIINLNIRKRLKREGKHKELESDDLYIQGNVGAAIATALYLYFNELHDEEKTVLTMKKASKRYSPWSSKIYNVTNFRR